MRLIDADALEKELNNERERFIALDMKGAEHILVHSALRLLREAQTIDAVSRWIPCEERLPEKEEKAYLVYLDNGHVCDCKWWCRNLISLEPTEQWRWDIFDLPQYARVLAWMPLPEPMKGANDGNK